ncbi:hypothetical protein NM208_g4900 [Fusarium decemcellulare]|uniref:Uncharacterized protein n=1 Tax=Fusarium decemcellulare TaxID=57161 RepID=A0ACC1SJ28_9HYPO|nr:hypothetical protein NM208_g4900 [Fusarium decemcellulare]
MSLDIEAVDALIEKARRLAQSLESLRPAFETPSKPTELTAALHDLRMYTRSKRQRSRADTLPLTTRGRTELPPSPSPSHDSLLSKNNEPSIQNTPLVLATPPYTPRPPSIGDSVTANASGPRKRLPSIARAGEDDVELGRDTKRTCQESLSTPKAKDASRDTVTSAQIPPDLGKLIYKIKNRDKLSRIPKFSIADPPTTLMLRRVAAIQGGPAIRQFCSLIHTRRSRETEMGLLHVESCGIERALELTKRLRVFTGRTAVGTFISRLVQFHIAEAVDDTKAGRLRADGAQIKQAMNKFGWTDAERPRFFQYLRQGRTWRSICGQHVGLLSLIPLKSEQPYGVSANDFLSMKGNELDIFTRLIDTPFVARFAEAAAAFQEMVMGVRDDAEFTWEKNQPELDKWEGSLPENDLLSLLQPHPSCEDCLFDKKDFADSSRPPGWPEDWAWPAHPLSIPPSQRQCDLCDDDPGCTCRQSKVIAARKPRVKSYGKQGIGLQAIAFKEGDLAYRKGDIIGQLTGRLIPAETHPHNSLWVVEMRRFDVENDPIVCQIDVGGVSSCFRNLNHSCRSSARMRPIRASGRWIMAVEAVRDVRHGEQLTINFGKAFLRNQGLRCECEVCQVPS